jgi:SAM-dependent methyltransferase
MTQHKYVLAGAASATEIARLEQVERYMRPITERNLLQLGLAPGWHCLEIGAGIGGVARFMAERVGASGRVVATDITPLFASDPALPQLEIRREDVLVDAVESQAFDLVHCRLLLANVANAELALARMVEALRPGGWLLVEEPGDGRLPAVGESSVAVAEFNVLMAAFFAAVQAARAVDMQLYRRLPALFEACGLVDVGGEHTQRLGGAEDRAALVRTLEAMRAPLATTDFVTSGAIDRLLTLASDPTLRTMGGSTLSLWGRRPLR